MDALHPRLLVDDFAAAFRFYDAVLPELAGAKRAGGAAAGPYASWEVADQGILALFDRGVMAASTGMALLPSGNAAAPDAVMFVCRVGDVEQGMRLCLRHGATPVAPPTDRPGWGPNLRTAHLRDPAGTLIELQSY
ncbi:glyoxalase/bleomycin resistance/extradiol dioxygenase family protein [Microbispora sp. RL4-1S]|uniref:Glyoxalase/bleomycin resistance/extradiol dioxygenase family protein n=1 Tax=Microbispora oryzae TaxID=2806554 RepID=A0A940WL39_9ACTN|nr:VOC family protein [Microbispora oryzae]MBP2702534.1 glyoxalase/bleomycin resistance/extradiol dioxygenase family protein [Microbispora oryzae]